MKTISEGLLRVSISPGAPMDVACKASKAFAKRMIVLRLDIMTFSYVFCEVMIEV